MDRKGIVAVTLAIITLVVWQIYYSRAMQKAAEAQRVATVAAAPATTEAPAVAPTAPPPQAPAPAPAALPQTPAVEEKVEQVGTDTLQYSFSNLGGGITKATLLKHKSERDTPVVINTFGQIPIGAISEIPGENVREPYAVTPGASSHEIVFERVDARQLKLTKKFTFQPVRNARMST